MYLRPLYSHRVSTVLMLPLTVCRYIAYDADGTLSGTGVPTFLVPNTNPNVLPNGTISSPNCKLNTNWSAYACTNVCYRR